MLEESPPLDRLGGTRVALDPHATPRPLLRKCVLGAGMLLTCLQKSATVATGERFRILMLLSYCPSSHGQWSPTIPC